MTTTMIDGVDLDRKLTTAITTLLCDHPFFATLLLMLRRVEDTSAPTMWTDGIRLGYNPTFVAKLTPAELVGVLAHEVAHVAGLHPWRRGSREPKAWNIACDQAVNQIVLESGLTLPSPHIPPVADKAAEQLYVELKEQEDQQSGKGKGKGGGPPDEAWMLGEVRDPSGEHGETLSEAEMEAQAGDMRVKVRQAATAAKNAGKLPAGLARYVDEALEPVVPWREILARFVDQHQRNDYSWTRPNRRYVQHGLILPSLWSPGFAEIALGLDTSGSIDQQTLREVCSEVLGALEVYAERGQQVTLPVLWFDHAVYPQFVSDAEELDPKGGGGTSFRVVFDWVREQEAPPKAVIMVTDGYCSDYGEDPKIPVLWILTQQHPGFSPPFGEVTCTLQPDR